MSGHDEEEDNGPSVDSTDPEERIAARRIRISKRVEIARREAMGEDPSLLKKEDKEEQSKSKRQMEDSRQRLTKLESDGSELVTNVRVAGDARETHRRSEEEEIQRQRTEKLEAEAKAGLERFEEITKKWEQANTRDLPMELHDLLKQQKLLSEAMIDEKNKLINDFQMELKSKDDQYVKDLKKQAEDIDLMIDRMEEQVKNLTKAYRDEVTQIEKSFETERGEVLETNHRRWEQALTGRGGQELDYMRQREKRVEDLDKQLQHLRVQDAEEYNQVKIKLETDVQVLEQQLQQMKATYQLNQEKLEYNFQVLKKRDEENTITKSQQKRKITRLQDVMNNLKVKLSKQEKQYREENQGLADDYKRITEQFKELQKKSKHFQLTDTKKFHDIWCMNEDQVKDQAGMCLEQDRIITEQQLGLTWKLPQDMWFMDNAGPIRSQRSRDHAAAASAHDVIMEAMSNGSSVQEDDPNQQREGEESTEEPAAEKTKLSMKTIKRVLELLCDESGFLVESKLNTLLAPLERDERCLMKLDAIFGALGVETEDDVHKLASYFVKYQILPEEATKKPTENALTDASFAVDSEKQVHSEMTIDPGAATQPTTSAVIQPPGPGEPQQDEFDEGENSEIQQITEAAGSIRSVRSDALELIHPNDVGKALRDFVNLHNKPTKEKVKFQTFRIISGEERDDGEDAAYWNTFPSVLSEKEEKVWKALLDGLEKYSDVLNQRSQLITETDSLRQQNAELRMLLHQYVNSKVNQELEIPPTRVLNLDVPQ